MANTVPMWWMRRQSTPDTPRRPEIPAKTPEPPQPPPVQSISAALSDRLRHMDSETLLLLALLWMLYQEHADPKLLLALAYIAL